MKLKKFKKKNSLLVYINFLQKIFYKGITSNHKSASYGECVLEPCTHRPSHPGNKFFRNLVVLLEVVSVVIILSKILLYAIFEI